MVFGPGVKVFLNFPAFPKIINIYTKKQKTKIFKICIFDLPPCLHALLHCLPPRICPISSFVAHLPSSNASQKLKATGLLPLSPIPMPLRRNTSPSLPMITSWLLNRPRGSEPLESHLYYIAAGVIGPSMSSSWDALCPPAMILIPS